MFNDFCKNECDTAFILPDLCGLAPQSSEIQAVFIIPLSVSVSDWTDKAVWSAIIDNSVEGKGKFFKGIGQIAPPEKVRRDYRKVSKITERSYTLEHLIPKNDYDFVKNFQCGNIGFKIWYLDVNENLYGGSSGIRPYFVDADLPRLRGEENTDEGIVFFSWRARCDADFVNIPGIVEELEGDENNVFGFSTTEVFGFDTDKVFG